VFANSCISVGVGMVTVTATPAFRTTRSSVVGDPRRSRRILGAAIVAVILALSLAVTLGSTPTSSHLPPFEGKVLLENAGGGCSGASASIGSPSFFDWQTKKITFGVASLPCVLGINGYPTQYIRALQSNGGTLLYTTGPSSNAGHYNFLTNAGVLSSATGFVGPKATAATAVIDGDTGDIVLQGRSGIEVVPLEHLDAVWSGSTYSPSKSVPLPGRLSLQQNGKDDTQIQSGGVAATSGELCLATPALICQMQDHLSKHFEYAGVNPLNIQSENAKFVIVQASGTVATLAAGPKSIPQTCSGPSLGALTRVQSIQGAVSKSSVAAERADGTWIEISTSVHEHSCSFGVTELKGNFPPITTFIGVNGNVLALSTVTHRKTTHLEFELAAGTMPTVPNLQKMTRNLTDSTVQVVTSNGSVVVNPVALNVAWLIDGNGFAPIAKQTSVLATISVKGGAGHTKPPPVPKGNPQPQVEVTGAKCTPPSEIPVPTNLQVLGNPTVASFTVHFDDIPITGQCAPKTYTATVRDLTNTVRDLTNNVANVGHSACTLKTFTCMTTGLEKATEYSITITASDSGKTSQPSLPLTVVTSFGSISAPKSTGQPSWNASTASWQVPFSQPNDAGATTTVTVNVSSCDSSALSRAGVSVPPPAAVTVPASRGRAPIPTVQNNLTGIPVSFTLSAVATVDVGGKQETSTSSVTAVHGCWLTPLPPACYGPAAKGSIHPTFTPTPPGLATSMTLTLTPSGCGSLGLFQPTFSYWVGQPVGIDFPCAQTTWQQSPTRTCSLIRSQYPQGIDPTQDPIWVQASYVDPGADPLPLGAPSFTVPPSRIDGGKQAFTWPASSVTVTAQATGSSTDGSNGWSTMTVTVGAPGNLFWNPSSMQAPQGLSMTPMITCGQAPITDFTVQNVSQSPGVLQYSVSEVSKASTYAVDDDLSTCSVSVSFSSSAAGLSPSTFSPTQSLSPNLFESGITTPQNSWFGSCTLSDGTTVVISSNTSPACGSSSVTAGGVNGVPAPGAFLSTQTSGCLGSSTTGVVVTCDPTVDPSTIQFLWRFGGHDYSVSTNSIVEQ